MMIRLCRFFLCCCLWAPCLAEAEVPVRLARILEQLPCKPERSDTLLACPQIGTDKKIVFSHDRHGEISHVGISIFAPEFKNYCNPYVCNCIERLYLELLLKRSEADRVRFLKEMDVRLVLNGYRLGSPQFPALKQGLALINDRNHMNIEERENSFVFVVTSSTDDEMQMTVPKDRELIFGTDKKEEDEHIDLMLRTSRKHILRPELPSEASLQKVEGKKELWRQVGMPFMIDSVRSDTYFTKREGRICPLFDPAYPCESLCNLLLGQITEPDVLLAMSHKMYGLSIPKFTIPLSDFIGQMPDNSVFYACARLIERGEQISGVLLISNPRYNYIHLMTVTVPVADLFVREPVVRAYLYTNVPQHNVRNLFMENNQ